MAISFEKLISDVQNFNDGLELPITIGEGDKATTERIRLGDIRGQLSNTMARYEAALQLEREKGSTLEQTLRTLKDAKPDDASTASGDRRERTTPADPVSDDDLNADPWSKKLRNTILSEIRKELKDNIEGLRGEHNQFADLSKKGVGALTQLFIKASAQQEYSRFNDWPKDYDAQRAYKEAGDRGYIDKTTGLPDLNRLHHDLTEDNRIEARAKALAEKMREDERKAESEKNASRFNKLGVPTGIRAKAKKDENKYKTLQDYMMSDDALPTDDEVRQAGIMGAMIR